MHSLRFPVTLAALAFLIACGDSPVDPPPGPVTPPPPPPPPASSVDLSWLRANAHPLRTASPVGSFDDLEPFRAMVGDARMVGLGEATHGSSEIFTMKHRLLEFLVKEMGFTTFGIEATYAEALDINDWVHGGPGDPAVLLSHLYFWTWNTEEVLEMMKWMRRHNENPGNAPKVDFYGFDMQSSRRAMDRAERFLRGVDSVAADSVTRLYSCYRAFQDNLGTPSPNYGAVAAEARAICRQGVIAAHALLEAGRPQWGSHGDAYEYALRAARVVVQNEEARSPGGGNVREWAMAENSRWLLERPGARGKVVLWAHNAHVWRLSPWQGWHLTRGMGTDYRIVGFSTHSGTVTAVDVGRGVVTQTIPAPPGVSYEAEFHRLDLPIFALDLRPLLGEIPAEAQWLREPRRHWMIGSVFSEANPQNYQLEVSLPFAYDILIHIDRTTNTRTLPVRYTDPLLPVPN